MYKKIFLFFSIMLIVAAGAFAQAPSADVGISVNFAGGEVASVSEAKITIQTRDGSIDAVLSAATSFKKIPPENPSIKNAVAASISDISAGDKVLITGLVAADKKTMPAKTVYLMTKADISQRHAKEAEQWKTRGITGKVAAVNPQTNQITVEVRGLMGATTSVALSPKDKAQFRRYAENSVKFSEAKESSIGEIKAGDMLRALGDKSMDGTTFAAEEVVTGAFQTVAGTVKSIDAAKNEVVITDLQTKKDVTVAVSDSTTLKKFPEDMAQRMAGMGGGAPGQGQATGPRPPGAGPAPAAQGGQTPAAGGPTAPGAGRAPGGARPGGIDDMLERFPNITVADLKAGDMIAVSSTRTANAERITAIKLLSGVEPFIRMAQMSSGGGQQRGGQGVNGNFNIPGLDGFGGP
jgi:ribosomal protein L24